MSHVTCYNVSVVHTR